MVSPTEIAQQLFQGQIAQVAPTTGIAPQPQLRPEQEAIAQALQQAPQRQIAPPQGVSLANELLSVSQDRLGNPIIRGLAGFLGARELQKERERVGTEKRAITEAKAKQQEIENIRAEETFALKEQAAEADVEQQLFERGISERGIALKETAEARLARAPIEPTARQKQIEASTIEGLEFKGGIVPSAKAAADVRGSQATARLIKQSIARIRNITKDVGTEAFSFTGNTSQLLNKERATLIVLQNRMADLGALAGGDLELLEAIVPDPTALFTGGKTFNKNLDAFEKSTDSDLRTIISAAGFKQPKQEKKKKIITSPVVDGLLNLADENVQRAFDAGFTEVEILERFGGR